MPVLLCHGQLQAEQDRPAELLTNALGRAG
jgi:hypothetical protein